MYSKVVVKDPRNMFDLYALLELTFLTRLTTLSALVCAEKMGRHLNRLKPQTKVNSALLFTSSSNLADRFIAK